MPHHFVVGPQLLTATFTVDLIEVLQKKDITHFIGRVREMF